MSMQGLAMQWAAIPLLDMKAEMKMEWGQIGAGAGGVFANEHDEH